MIETLLWLIGGALVIGLGVFAIGAAVGTVATYVDWWCWRFERRFHRRE
jgi:hypothetical protein